MTCSLKWPNLAQHAYTYGTHLEWLPRGVLFSNPQMPPGFVITSWFSRTNFQMDRALPTLPLLRRGERYHLRLKAETTPANGIYLKVSYLNPLDDLVGTEIIKGNEGDFTYPQEAHSYRIDLVNAGCESVLFHELQLTVAGEEQLTFPGSLDRQEIGPSEPIYLVLLEPNLSNLSSAVEQELAKRGTFSSIQASTPEEQGYMDAVFESYVTGELTARSLDLEQVHFVGYGPLGNLFALYWASRFDRSAYITGYFGSEAWQLQSLHQDANRLGELMTTAFSYMEESPEKIVSYGDLEENPDLSLVEGLLDQSDLLLSLPLRD